MILTSNFKIAGHLPQAVAISLGVPRGWRGARCTGLAPPRPLIKIMDPETFIPLYKAQVLDKLDPHKIIKDLGGDNFIMLCWEDPGSSVIAGSWRPGCRSRPGSWWRSSTPSSGATRIG